MSDDVLSGKGGGETVTGQAVAAAARPYAVPPVAIVPLLVAGAVLGVLGDTLLRAPDPPGLNLSLWIASVAVAALVLHRHAALTFDRARIAWLVIGVLFAAGLAWRDAVPLKLLALAAATLTFAIAAHRPAAAWVRRAGILQYAGALGLGALHAWTASALAVADATLASQRSETGGATRGQRTAAIARGLVIATPLIVVFGALFMAADAVFADMIVSIVDIDLELIAGHVLLFLVTAWIATGYLRGFLSGTELTPLRAIWQHGAVAAMTPKRPTLGITEVATILAALNLLFLVFVIVQFRYLFGGDALVQVTPDLTYADYARRGFFELVAAVFLVVPVLLVADWLLERRSRGDARVFRSLAGAQIALVLGITASAFQRLRLYHESYGLTESRFYAMVLLIWIGAMLLWLAATVLRSRRDAFAFGALVSGLATVGVLFVINPDAVVARTNVARMATANAPVRFDVAYATSLSADAVPALLAALPVLPPDVRCPLARHMLRQWSPERERSLRNWNQAAARASDAVRDQESQLRSMVGPEQKCGDDDRQRGLTLRTTRSPTASPSNSTGPPSDPMSS